MPRNRATTKGTMRKAAALLLSVAVMSVLVTPASAASSPPPARTVVVVLAPYVSWEDISSGRMPFLQRLSERSAVGALNMRTPVGTVSPQTLAQSALTLSAGDWVQSEPEEVALGAYSVDETFETGNAKDAYERLMGATAASSNIVYLGLPEMAKTAQTENPTLRLGLLGQTIEDAGGVTAAIGNSDAGMYTVEAGRHRPAALFAMDEKGQVSLGDVSRRMLVVDGSRPFGLSTDVARLTGEYRKVTAEVARRRVPSLIVVDPGETQRALAFSEEAASDVAARQRESALSIVDGIAETVHGGMPEGAVFMLVSPVAWHSEGPGGLAPVLIEGPGFQGVLTSSSTHRLGLASGPDVSATILSVLGLERPVDMIGNAMFPKNAKPSGGPAALLQHMSDAAVSVDGAKSPVINGYILLTLVLLLASTLLLVRRFRRQPLYSAALGLLLAAASLPVASYVMAVFDRWPSSSAEVAVALLVATGVIWALAMLVASRWPGAWPVAAVSALTAGVLLADQWAGGPLSFTNIFGYSPLMGARYYGMGNESAAMLVGSLLVAMALVLDEARQTRWALVFRRFGVPLLAAAAVVTASAPFFGANVGVAVWGTVTFALFWADVNGHKPGWKTALLILLLVVVVIAGYSFLDLVAKSGAQTHLGRAWTSAEAGGIKELWTIVARKAETNVRVLTHTNWSYVAVAILLFMGYMRWRPAGELHSTLKDYPAFGAAVTASLVGGLVAYFTEDSGIIIPALALLYVEAGVLYLMLTRQRDEDVVPAARRRREGAGAA